MPTTTTTTNKPTTLALAHLQPLLQDRAITPALTAQYHTSVTGPWSQTCWTRAAGYLLPQTVAELTQALAILKHTHARFALRSTGHNPNAGFSSADGSALVLDLSRFREMELTAEGAARIGAGCTWGEVFFFAPDFHGSDEMRVSQVLLADGGLVNANAYEHPELYRALKGGGTNFRIVTRFDLETHPLRSIRYTIELYSPDDYMEINKATAAVQMAMEEDPKIGLFTNFNDGVVARAITSVTTRVSHDLYDRVYLCWMQLRKTLPAGCVLHYTIQPMGTAGVQAGSDRGGNIMGLEAVPQCWWVFTSEWSQDAGEDVDAAAHGAVRTMAEMVEALARKEGVYLDFKCMKFAGAGQKVLGSYGAKNVERMQAVAEEYDPEGVWQGLLFGGFLLRES
ncbi:FAD-binding oxidoreductase [Aspergillus aculeatinus CBS 121060]|uniref:FAD-binding domain-containing protein n=1 Tax=Aspergillus aculeatinus CBS 121060 TaxID=1448322 RepID=A0ACD1HH62_9EURO|nr:FAD-binding domain-containing protein [Aspergillus aculeatinus CBS 121060]RAH72997.1 FAD-binding domain-containing protein [Aspergillus aculeatinus CBS 121060]